MRFTQWLRTAEGQELLEELFVASVATPRGANARERRGDKWEMIRHVMSVDYSRRFRIVKNECYEFSFVPSGERIKVNTGDEIIGYPTDLYTGNIILKNPQGDKKNAKPLVYDQLMLVQYDGPKYGFGIAVGPFSNTIIEAEQAFQNNAKQTEVQVRLPTAKFLASYAFRRVFESTWSNGGRAAFAAANDREYNIGRRELIAARIRDARRHFPALPAEIAVEVRRMA